MTQDELTLGQILKKEYDVFEQFNQLLEQESKALVSASPEALMAVVTQKADITDTLNQLGQDRLSVLEKVHVNIHSSQDVNNWFAARPQKDPLSVQWERLRDLARTVIARNEANGKLIQHRLDSTQEALHILQKAAGTQEFYGRDGKIKNPFISKGY